jgi:benzodiazapine receptor
MKLRRYLVLAAFIIICLSAGMIGARYAPGEWYSGLNKPSLNPPAFIFAPVWTVLYILMGISAWLVWIRGKNRKRLLPLSVFAAQLVLNALWSYLFFGLRRPDLGFIDIVAMLALIWVTVILFLKVRRAAGLLLVPYLAWVSFATVLNYQIWRLNL